VALKDRVRRAIELAGARQPKKRNVDLDAEDLDRVAPLDAHARKLVAIASRRFDLSARALQSLRRVARTLADLDGGETVDAQHVAQALALRVQLA